MERRAIADGLATRTVEEGSGPLLLLVHGGAPGCSADDWSELFAPLAAAGFRALAYDQPGFGRCDDPPDLSVPFRSRYLLALLDALGVAQAAIVGHSQAGRLVLEAALHAPARVNAGVILCTGSLLPPLGERAPEVATPDHAPTPAESRAYLEGVVYDRSRVTDAMVERYHRFSQGRNFDYAVRRGALPPEPAPATPNWQRLAEPTVPLTLIYGANDRGNVPARIALARERYPQLPIHLLERCGHFAQWDHPGKVAELVIAAARR